MTLKQKLKITAVWFSAIIIILTGAYMSFVEPYLLHTARWTVATPKWQDQKPLKVALLSDTHASWPWMTPERLETYVAAINAEKPDIILLLGDYVGHQIPRRNLDPALGVAPLKDLRAPCGVYSVLIMIFATAWNGPRHWRQRIFPCCRTRPRISPAKSVIFTCPALPRSGCRVPISTPR
jgi:hypothetical protein